MKREIDNMLSIKSLKQKISGRVVQQKLVNLAEAFVGVTVLLTIIVMNLVTLSLT